METAVSAAAEDVFDRNPDLWGQEKRYNKNRPVPDNQKRGLHYRW